MPPRKAHGGQSTSLNARGRYGREAEAETQGPRPVWHCCLGHPVDRLKGQGRSWSQCTGMVAWPRAVPAGVLGRGHVPKA